MGGGRDRAGSGRWEVGGIGWEVSDRPQGPGLCPCLPGIVMENGYFFVVSWVSVGGKEVGGVILIFLRLISPSSLAHFLVNGTIPFFYMGNAPLWILYTPTCPWVRRPIVYLVQVIVPQ